MGLQNSYLHSGKLGDIVYGLPAVKALGVGRFYIRVGALPDFSEVEAGSLLPLLKSQPYIVDAQIWRGEPCKYDLDSFRDYANAKYNLADSHLDAFGLPRNLKDDAWLSVPNETRIPDRPVVFARTLRYRGVPGFWEICHRLFGHQAAFVGTQEEHLAYEAEIGSIPYAATSDLLQLASLIAGAKLFVGNQSCAYALAEGLKQNAILEVCTGIENCMFSRPNLLAVTDLKQL